MGTVVLLAVTALGGLAFAFLLRAPSRLRVLVAGVLLGLTVWALLQYLGFPLVQRLITEKGFPPQWCAASFAVYGLVLGAVLALAASGRAVATAVAATPAAVVRAAVVPPRRRRRAPMTGPPGTPSDSGWRSGGGAGAAASPGDP